MDLDPFGFSRFALDPGLGLGPGGHERPVFGAVGVGSPAYLAAIRAIHAKPKR